MRKVTVDHAPHWIGFAFHTIRRHPGVFLGMGLIQALIGQIPIIGGVVMLLLGFALTAGAVYAAREADLGRTPQIGQLFKAFDGEIPLGRFVALCLPAVGIGLVLMIVLVIVVIGAVGGDAARLQDLQRDPQAMLALFKGHLLTLFVLVCIGLMLNALLTFSAVPRVLFDQRGAFEAMGDSLMANWRSLGAFLLTGVLVFLCGLVASLAVGLVVFLPLKLLLSGHEQLTLTAMLVALGALSNAFGGPLMYAAWKDLFADAAPASGMPAVVEAAM